MFLTSSPFSVRKWASLFALLVLFSFVPRSHAQSSTSPQGDWEGALPDGRAIICHLDEGGSGIAIWALQSDDESPIGYSMNGSQITVHFASTTSYTGSVNGNQMSGTLSKPGRSLRLILTKAGALAADHGTGDAAAVQGDWMGILPGNMPIAIHLDADGTGKGVEVATKIDSEPVQYSLAAGRITMKGSDTKFTATVNANTMNGTWSRTDSKDLPLTLTKAAQSAVAAARNAKASSAIHDAAVNGELAMVRALVKNNPGLVFNKDDSGETPLHLAAYMGHKDVVEFLLESKADVNAKDNSGMTPMHMASLYGYKDVAELLRQHGGHE